MLIEDVRRQVILRDQKGSDSQRDASQRPPSMGVKLHGPSHRNRNEPSRSSRNQPNSLARWKMGMMALTHLDAVGLGVEPCRPACVGTSCLSQLCSTVEFGASQVLSFRARLSRLNGLWCGNGSFEVPKQSPAVREIEISGTAVEDLKDEEVIDSSTHALDPREITEQQRPQSQGPKALTDSQTLPGSSLAEELSSLTSFPPTSWSCCG